MENLGSVIHRKLKIYYIFVTIISSVCFIMAALITLSPEHLPFMEYNATFERYGILLTLIGIPVALKLFHDRIKKVYEANKENMDIYFRKYRLYYFIRLIFIEMIFFFNVISLYLTGAKNFYFMVIVSIFALFLCAPQKAHLEKTVAKDDNDQEEI